MSQDEPTPIEQAIANLKARGKLVPLVVPKAGPIKMESPIRKAMRERAKKAIEEMKKNKLRL